MPSNYVLQLDEKSYCPKCNQNVYLLMHKDAVRGKPAFYVCFGCVELGEVGKGRVTII